MSPILGIVVNPSYYQDNMFEIDLVKTQINNTNLQLDDVASKDKKIIRLQLARSLNKMYEM